MILIKVKDWVIRIALPFLVLQFGCATRNNIYSEYHEIARETSPAAVSKRTVVFFLVDGLSVPALQTLLRAGRLPEMQKFFPESQKSFALGRAVFPTLTYPNISSILTAQGIDGHPIIGNQVYRDGHIINYESPLSVGSLNESLTPLSVFKQLKQVGNTSVSLDQYFGLGATVQYSRDIESGVAYLRGDYAYIDDKMLDSANRLLGGLEPSRWPSLLFIHLIGVDGLSHEQGPSSVQALDYIQRLDGKLKRTFEILEGAQAAGKSVVTLLTADHGFVATPRYSAVEKVLHQLAPEVVVLNQHRLLSLYFPASWSDARKLRLLEAVRRLPGVELIVQRSQNVLRVSSATGAARDARIRYQRGRCSHGDYRLSLELIEKSDISLASYEPYLCPETFDDAAKPYYYPYFVSNTAAYFHSAQHPDAVVLSSPGVSFTSEARGQHGGATSEEVLVPVLLRGAVLADPSRVVPTFELLKFAVKEPVEQQEQEIVALPKSGRVSTQLQQELILASPVSRWSLQTRAESDSQEHTLSSETSLGLSGEWRQYWDKLFSTSVSYQFKFARLHDDASSDQFGSAPWFQQEAFLGGAYHFGATEKLFLHLGASEQFFPHRFSDGTAPLLSVAWVPEVNLGTRSRIVALPFGEIYLGGSLGLLLPREIQTFSLSPGFKQGFSVGFERPVGTTDVAAANLSVEHQTQNTSLESRSGLTLLFTASYGLTFAE